MIRAIIIDDEQHCIDRLSKLVKENCSETVALEGTFQTVESGLRAITSIKPQLIFLDVQILDKTGFDLLQQAGNINFEVIFTTAFDKYAVQAFKFSAIDYLLKPVDATDLLQAVNKLQSKISKEETAKKIDVLLHNFTDTAKRISVPTMSGLVFLTVNDIIRCESEVNYTTIFLKDKQKMMVAKTLKEFEELLTDYNFFRIHNSHLINLAHIKSYNKGKGGFVTMNDNSQVEVSTRRKEDFIKRLSEV